MLQTWGSPRPMPAVEAVMMATLPSKRLPPPSIRALLGLSLPGHFLVLVWGAGLCCVLLRLLLCT